MKQEILKLITGYLLRLAFYFCPWGKFKENFAIFLTENIFKL